MQTFGAGVIIGVPLQLGDGTAITNPSPIEFGILQEVTCDDSFESKPLYGALQYPFAVGRGKANNMVKAKIANINAELYASFVFGLSLGSHYEAMYQDLTGTTVPTSPYAVTPTSTTFIADLGVTLNAVLGVPMTRVATGPTGGQYSMATGVYTFASQDYGKSVYINYAYQNDAAVPTGRLMQVTNQQMGYQPSFELWLMKKYSGKTRMRRYFNVVCNKMTDAAKNDDWTMYDTEFSIFAGSNGRAFDEWDYE